MSPENEDSQNDSYKAEEPEAGYGEKKITFFESIEEMNEDQYRQYAKMTPEERLQTVCRMREAVWPEKSTKPIARHIHIKKMNTITAAHKEFLLSLLETDVSFVVIGYAVIYHGYPRLTMDLDILLKPDNDNKKIASCVAFLWYRQRRH